jgi:uncharacterized protein (DUF2236 family)
MARPQPGVSWRVNAERLALLGWSRAILLQLAHPLVAAGVHDHSSFRAGLVSTAARLHHTIRAMLALTFGTAAQRDAALAGICAIHRRVHGTLHERVGCFPAGTPYSAEDPQLLIWVHATLLESVLTVHDRLVTPLSIDERDTYCREASPIVRALGVRETNPPLTWGELKTYLDQMYSSGAIAVGTAARGLADAVLHPPFSALIWPASYVNRLFTVGLLPVLIREQYGFSWNAANEHALRRWTIALRGMRRMTPDLVAQWPESRRATPGTSAPHGIKVPGAELEQGRRECVSPFRES